MKKITLIGVLVASVLLSACGGGGDGDASPGSSTSPYTVFEGNANGDVVLDGANTRFSVRTDDRRLVHLSTNQPLTGLTVASNGDVLSSGTKVGVVLLTAGADGKTIAALSCSGPAPNLGAMTITITNTTWSYRCASNTGTPAPDPGNNGGGGNGGSGGSGSGSGENAAAQVRTSCIRLEPMNSLGWQVRNNCQETVFVSYCFVNPDPDSWERSSRCSDNAYGSTGPMAPGSISSINSPGNNPEVKYSWRAFGCAATARQNYYPRMSNQGLSGTCV